MHFCVVNKRVVKQNANQNPLLKNSSAYKYYQPHKRLVMHFASREEGNQNRMNTLNLMKIYLAGPQLNRVLFSIT